MIERVRRILAARALFLFAFWIVALGDLPLAADEVRYELTIAQGTVNITGSPATAMTINGGVPGPTLRFGEGDVARILVHNEMDVESSIHWHGLLVPPGMDGVPNLSFPPIAPHTTFTFEILLRQSGTYWYHSHTQLQEQRGVYGSIVVSPRQGEADASDRDHVVLLSDWSDTDPKAILRTLRRGSEWFAVERGTGQSILGAARLGMLGDYFSRELRRMPAMDLADVAYDRFLANGQPESSLPATAGELVRLRLIDGSATSFFHIEFAGGPMTVVSADGIDVEPFQIDRLLISVAETYDVLVRIPKGGSYELRATAHDASGYTSVWLGEGEKHAAPTVPYPNLYRPMGPVSAKQVLALTPAGSMGMPEAEVDAGRFDSPGMNMMGMSMEGPGGMAEGSMDGGSMDGGSIESEDPDPGEMTMDHPAMADASMDPPMAEANAAMGRKSLASDSDRGGKGYGRAFGWLASDLASREEVAADGMSAERPWPPYRQLRARTSTALDPKKPVREVRLTLDGDMERYVWFLNGKPLSESDDIEIKKGEVVRFIMINRTMMHHPMHLHGHFFRVLNGQGDFSPLKHTVDVEPMSTTVIEFDANEFGDWFFHCHLLYHMKTGMARVVSYQGFVPSSEAQAVRSKLYEEHWYSFGGAELMSHMTFGSVMAENSRNILMAEWEIGWQDVDGTEGEVILTWDRYINRFFTYFAGLDVEGTDDEIEDPRGVVGIRYLLPFNVASRLWIDSDSEARLTLDKMFQLTPRLGALAEIEYDTLNRWEGFARMSYALSQRVDLLVQWHSDYGLGSGLTIRF